MNRLNPTINGSNETPETHLKRTMPKGARQALGDFDTTACSQTILTYLHSHGCITHDQHGAWRLAPLGRKLSKLFRDGRRY